MSRSWLRPFGTFDLLFWTVVLCISLVVGVQSLGNGDGWKLFMSTMLVLTSGVWLVRIFWARREHRRQEDHRPLT
ncbi:hypothetical protein [Blastococcus sp. SYSU DS0539]